MYKQSVYNLVEFVNEIVLFYNLMNDLDIFDFLISFCRKDETDNRGENEQDTIKYCGRISR